MTAVLLVSSTLVARAGDLLEVETNCVAQVTLTSVITYQNPFVDLELDAVITEPNGLQLQVPMFWDGDDRWCLRYASSTVGVHTFRTVCSDITNTDLHDVEGSIEVTAYTGVNNLYRHGPIRVAADNRHFEHTDGTPFLWLGDTW